MTRFFFTIFLLLFSPNLFAQNELPIIVKYIEDNSVLPYAIVKIEGTDIKGITNEKGYLKLSNIPNGMQKVAIIYAGCKEKVYNLFFPIKLQRPLTVWLEFIDYLQEEW